MPELQSPTPIGAGISREPHTSAKPPDGSWLPEDLDLGWYVRELQAHWKGILVGGVVGALVGFVVMTFKPIVYEGTTTLLVVNSSKSTADTTTPATFRAIFANGTLVSQIVKELGLDQTADHLTPQRFLEDALDVEAPVGTNVIRVKVQLSDPKLAAAASQRLAQKAVALSRDLNQQEGSAVQEQLKRHLDDAATKLRTAEQDVVAFQQKSQVDLLKEDTQALLGQRGGLLKLVVAIESEKAKLKMAQQEKDKQKPTLSAPRASGAEEALRRTDNTTEVLDPSNPFVNPVYQSLEYQIALSNMNLASLEQQRAELMEKQKVGGQEFAKLNELYSKQIELARLQTAADLAKRIYSDLLVRYEESRTAALGNSAQLQLVDEAIPADRPVSRKRATGAALGFVTGALAAGLIGLMLASRQRFSRVGSSAS